MTLRFEVWLHQNISSRMRQEQIHHWKSIQETSLCLFTQNLAAIQLFRYLQLYAEALHKISNVIHTITNPKWLAHVYLLQGKIYRLLHERDQCLTSYNRSLDFYRHPATYISRAFLYLERSDHKSARADVAMAWESIASSTHYCFSHLYHLTGLIQEAKEDRIFWFNQSVELNKNAKIYLDMAECVAFPQWWVEKALELHPSHPSLPKHRMNLSEWQKTLQVMIRLFAERRQLQTSKVFLSYAWEKVRTVASGRTALLMSSKG